MSSSILVNHLIVVGTKKNYVVDFQPGVNIIYGDSNTGKSSILNLIDYLLGARKIDLYPEIEAVCRYAILDVTLNDNRYSVKRDIFDNSKPIEVYPCAYNKIEQFAVKKYLPTFKANKQYQDLEFYSDFLLNALNLTNLKIKQAPSKDDSKLTRLSFRDIFKYCYVDQDDLGSKKFLKSDNYALQVRNTEVFKYIFNALDSQITELEQSISNKTQKKHELENKFKTVSDFLRESEFGSLLSLDDEITRTDDAISEIEAQLAQVNKRVMADDEVYRAIKTTLSEIELEIKLITQKMSDNELKIERFTRLKNDYSSDIAKFTSSLEARRVIGEIPEEISLCPVCDNELHLESAKTKFEIPPTEKVKHELNSLKRRIKDTEKIISESKRQWDLEQEKLRGLNEQEFNARELIDKNTNEMASPYLAERDMYVGQRAELKQKRKELVSRLKIRNQHDLLTKTIKSLETSIIKLKENLEELNENAPSMIDILSNLADNLKDYLMFIKIQKPTGINLSSNRFTPIVREIEYANITSGGLRTIIVIGYMCSLIKEALRSKMSYPSFLMIDTVGKYLGKTHSRYRNETSTTEDAKEGVSDPQKYQNIFEYIIKLSNEYEDKNKVCQFILVDNDVPDHIVDKLSGFVVAHFSSEKVDGLPVGFIDDARTNI